MSKKHFSWLLGVTVAVAVLVLFIPAKTGRENGFEPHLLMPGLAASVNEVDHVRISAAGEGASTTLQRKGDRWVVLEYSSYPANWETLRGLLADLSQAQVIEKKTANPEFYPRLGVEDPSSPGASGMLLEFDDTIGTPALIIGNRAQGRDGRYVRLQDEASSVLIDRQFEMPLDAVSWLNRDIIDIADSSVVEVVITHADGEQITIRKVSAEDTDFELLGMPEGRELQSNWTVNSIGGGLQGLSLDAVSPESDVDWTGSTTLRMLTADGLQIDAELLAVEELRWIRLEASASTEEIDDELDSRIEEINQRVSGWAYQIALYNFDAMNKRMSDLLKAEDQD
jgi:hypothetical protein